MQAGYYLYSQGSISDSDTSEVPYGKMRPNHAINYI
jgi:hypothetical protein